MLAVLLLPLGWICWKLIGSLWTIEIRMGVGVVLYRYENPILFWAVITIQCAFTGLLLAIIGFITLILPHHVVS